MDAEFVSLLSRAECNVAQINVDAIASCLDFQRDCFEDEQVQAHRMVAQSIAFALSQPARFTQRMQQQWRDAEIESRLRDWYYGALQENSAAVD